MSTTTQNDWEEIFDLRFPCRHHAAQCAGDCNDRIKDFIRKERADARKEVKESNINLLTKELRWCQSDVAKGVFGMTIEQKQWFMNGLIQAITMLHRPKTKADWERIEATLREEEGK